MKCDYTRWLTILTGNCGTADMGQLYPFHNLILFQFSFGLADWLRLLSKYCFKVRSNFLLCHTCKVEVNFIGDNECRKC